MSLLLTIVLGCGSSCADDEPMKTVDSGNSSGSADAVMTGKVNLLGKDFDNFLTPIMTSNSSVKEINPNQSNLTETIYNLNGIQI